MTSSNEERPEDAAAILEETWQMLGRAVVDRRSPMHTPTVATIGLDGFPRARTVVFRRLDRAARAFTFHTDLRSPKVAELRRDPRLTLHFYDAGHKRQFRVEAVATIHHDDEVAQRQWEASHPNSRECYRSEQGPSSPIERPEQGDARMPNDGQANFVAVVAVARRIEWLFLHHDGHRRVRFDFDADAVASRWLTP